MSLPRTLVGAPVGVATAGPPTPSPLIFPTGFLSYLTAGFLCVEVFLRFFSPVRFCDAMETFRHDPELGVSFVPSLHVLQTTDYQQEVKINQLGTVNFQEDFTRFKSLVFAVGDSFTQGVGLPADASYPAQLDLVLNIRDGSYEALFGVVNLGMGGYGGMQNRTGEKNRKNTSTQTKTPNKETRKAIRRNILGRRTSDRPKNIMALKTPKSD